MKKITVLMSLLLIGIVGLKAQDWTMVSKVVASDRTELDFYGASVAISGNYAIVGSPEEENDVNGENRMTDAGSAYILERNESGDWHEVQKIVASDRSRFSEFGKSVSISGNRALVGAFYSETDEIMVGGAYIFERDTSGTWNEVQKITAADYDSGDYFGYSVAMSEDYIIVGAYFEEHDADGGNYLNHAGSAYIFEQNEGGEWVETQKIVASDRKAIAYFGYSVSVSGDYAIVGTDNAGESAYIFKRDESGTWNEVQILKPNNGNNGHYYGNPVSISGEYAIVGARNDYYDYNEMNRLAGAGACYIFKEGIDGTWTEVQKITASDREEHDNFGGKLAISGDYILVGAYGEDAQEDRISAGAVYSFKLSESGVWNEDQKIVAPIRNRNDAFGVAIAISEGNALVGAHLDDDMVNTGSVYFYQSSDYSKEPQSISFSPLSDLVYGDSGIDPVATASSGLPITYSSSNEFVATIVNGKIHTTGVGSCLIYANQVGNERYASAEQVQQLLTVNRNPDALQWSEVVKITASDAEELDNFGYSASIFGNYAAVGATSEDEDENGNNYKSISGSVYIYERNEADLWSEVQKVVASDRSSGDRFGSSVALNENYLVVGARMDGHDANGINSINNAGSAYIFERGENGTWSEVQKIVASDRTPNDNFGVSVAIEGDYLFVGAYYQDYDENGANYISDAGAVYVFKKDALGVWNQTQKIVSPSRASVGRFGMRLSMSGGSAIIGANGEHTDEDGLNTVSDAGAAYVYTLDDVGNWSLKQKIVASDRATEDYFGSSVDIYGSYAIVGALYEDEDAVGSNTQSNAGSAYIFMRDEDGRWNEVQKITASDRASGDAFGNYSIAISDRYAFVGAYKHYMDENGDSSVQDAGALYVFKRNADGRWFETQKICEEIRQPEDYFGYSVGISGNYAIVASGWDDEGSVEEIGSGYIFELPAREEQTITFNSLNTMEYGDADVALNAVASSGLPVSLTTSDESVATIANGVIHIVGAGTCTIYANQEGNDEYAEASQAAQTLVVNPRELTVSGALARNKEYDGTANVTIINAILVGVLEGDEVILENATTGTFASVEEGTDLEVATQMTITGADAGNYTLIQPEGLTADIVGDDTDNDGIPNSTDTDDDNDGYSDTEEIEAGTDPLDNTEFPQWASIGSNDFDFTIYPNPASKEIIVATSAEIAELEIFSMLGKKQTVVQLSSNSYNIEMLPRGKYVVIIKADSSIFKSVLIKE